MYYSLVLNTIFVAAVAAVPTKEDKKQTQGSFFVPPTVAYCHDAECSTSGGAAVMTPSECMPARSGSSWGGFGASAGLGLGLGRRTSHDDDDNDSEKKKKCKKDEKHGKKCKDVEEEEEEEEDQHIIVAYPEVGQEQQNCPIFVYQTTDCSDSGSVMPGFEGWVAPTFTSGLTWKRGDKEEKEEEEYEVEVEVYEVEEKEDKKEKKCKKDKKHGKKCKKDKKHKNDKKSSHDDDDKDSEKKSEKKCKKDNKHGKECKKDDKEDVEDPGYVVVPATSGGRPYDVSQWGSMQVRCGASAPAPVVPAVDPKDPKDPKESKGYTTEPEVKKADPSVVAYPSTETEKAEEPKKVEEPKADPKSESAYPTTETEKVDPKPESY
ncbi:hypothetical protein PG988_001215 [Apiospora saccharicola]